MKKKLICLIAMVIMMFSFAIAGCDSQSATVKVKFYESTSSETETALFPGSYDLADIVESGIDDYTPTKVGYRFVKWTLDKSGTVEFNPETYVGEDLLIKVYAQWEELRKIVTYSGTQRLGIYYYDDLVNGTDEITDATRTNYEFLGWTTDSSNEVPFVLSNYTYPQDTKTVNIYANFEIVTTVTFMKDGESVLQTTFKKLQNGTSTVPTVTKENYNFDGWYLDSEFNTIFNVNTYEPYTETQVLYAKFTEKPKITYYSDESTVYAEYYIDKLPAGGVTAPTKEGYNFVNWLDSQNQSFVFNQNATTDQKAYAQWEQRVTVNFKVGDETVATKYLDQIKVKADMPTAEKDTYTFKGWYLDSDFNSAFNVGYTTAAKNITVYAKFEKITTIVFKNGDETVSQILLSSLKDGTTSLPTATKEGYNFVGWTLDNEGENAFNYVQYTTDEGSITVYAQWTAKLKVTYYVDSTVYLVKYYEDITSNEFAPANPTKEGYFFVKWLDSENNDFVLNKDSDSSVSAYAKFYANPVVSNIGSQTVGKVITVSWDNADNTTYYVKLDDGNFIENAGNSYVLPSNSTIGSHTVYVKAVFMEHESEIASIVVVNKIDFSLSGVEFDKNTRVISWDEDSNASYYIVKFNNAETGTIKETAEYVVDWSVLHGDYSFTVEAYATIGDTAIGSFSAQTETVTIESIERWDSVAELWRNENDDYILLVGGTYSFGSYQFTESDYYTLSDNDTKVTIKANAAGKTFNLTTTDSKTISVKAENAINSIVAGANWTAYQTRSAESDSSSFLKASKPYEVGTGDEDYYLDLSIDGSGAYNTDYVLDFTGSVDGDTDISKYFSVVSSSNQWHIQWTALGKALAKGTSVTINAKCHFTSLAQRNGVTPSTSFTFIINDGVNAYGYEDLKEKVGEVSNKTVNMHQNVIITSDMIASNLFTEATNSEEYSLITRYSNGYEEFTLNGNYFKIDISKLPRGVYTENDLGTGYTVYYVHSSVIYVSNASNTTVQTLNVNNESYQVIDNAHVNFNNLEIYGNASLGITAVGEEAIKAELKSQSGAIIGICAEMYSDTYNNCVITHTIESVNYLTYNRKINSVGVRMKNNIHYVNDCVFSDNWANNSYLWGDGKLVLTDSKIGTSSGFGVIVGDCGNDSGSAGTFMEVDGPAVVYEDATNGICLTNFPTVIYDNTTTDNWQYGSEQYYTAYGFSGTIAGYKTTINSNVESATGSKYTVLKVNSDNTDKLNMAFQVLTSNHLFSYDIGYVQKDGSTVLRSVRTTKVGDNYIPTHSSVLVNSGTNYKVLFPLGAYSSQTAFESLYNDITSQEQSAPGELAVYYQYCNNAITWDIAKTMLTKMIYVLGEAVVQNKLFSVDFSSASDQTAKETYLIYTYAFMQAEENSNGPIYVEVTLPNVMQGGKGLMTIMLEATEKTA